MSVDATKLSCAVLLAMPVTRSAPGRDGANRSFEGRTRSMRVFDQREVIDARLRTFQYQAPFGSVAPPLARRTWIVWTASVNARLRESRRS